MPKKPRDDLVPATIVPDHGTHRRRYLVAIVAVFVAAGLAVVAFVPRSHGSAPTGQHARIITQLDHAVSAAVAPLDNTALPAGITMTDALPAAGTVPALAPNGLTFFGPTGAPPRAPPVHNPACLKCGGDSTGRIVPADCLCGGPGGSATLAHISPWLNNDCDSSVGVGSTSVYVWVNSSGGLVKTYAGTAQWRYSNYRSCRSYQWIRFNLNMSVVHRSEVSDGFSTMIWLTQDPLDWTTFTTNFTGGASDGAFSSFAVMAGPLRTTGGIWTSLAQFGPNRNWTSA